MRAKLGAHLAGHIAHILQGQRRSQEVRVKGSVALANRIAAILARGAVRRHAGVLVVLVNQRVEVLARVNLGQDLLGLGIEMLPAVLLGVVQLRLEEGLLRLGGSPVPWPSPAGSRQSPR